jgi:RNase H-fold protein (predicted Holliday junction resolvase)
MRWWRSSAAEDGIGSVVVGVPIRLDWIVQSADVRTKAMVALLSARLTIPVVTQDERCRVARRRTVVRA